MANGQRRPETRPQGSPRRPSVKIELFIAIAGGSFLAATIVLLLMLYHAEALVRLGLVGNLYYITLVPLGIAVAMSLFGVLRSYAVYSGKITGGRLELGGPIVAFVLVVVLGFYLIPDPKELALTVFVHGERGRQEILLRNTGSMLLDLGGDRRREAIGDKGQAYFPGIPPSFRGQSVGVSLDAEGFELAKPNGEIMIVGDSAYVPIRYKSVQLTGYVRASDSQPISGAAVNIAGVKAVTDETGFFQLTVSGGAVRRSSTLQVSAPGYATWHSQAILGGNEVSIILDRVIN